MGTRAAIKIGKQHFNSGAVLAPPVQDPYIISIASVIINLTVWSDPIGLEAADL